MNDVVERVADAIEATTGTVGFSYREWVVLAARAAIEAMREPSMQMHLVMVARLDRSNPYDVDLIDNIWDGAISTALADASPDIGKEGKQL